MNKHISIGQYLLDRLQQLGVEHIFGLPGDYVLRFDKLIEEHPIEFINTTRENTAGYAADAYGRIRGLGVACITYGVGINITNALSQAYVENSPLVVISGAAGTDEYQKSHQLHHLINKSCTIHGDTTQLEIFRNITVDQAVLNDPETAKFLIEKVLTSCLTHQQPVYIEIPRDMVNKPISLTEKKIPPLPPSDPLALKEALEETAHILRTSKNPLIWAGHFILRKDLSQHLINFAEMYKIPIVSSLLGKTVINEKHPLFRGVYIGKMSHETVQKMVEACDCALILGVMITDIDTGIFTAKLDQTHRIIATPHTLNIGKHHFLNVSFEDYIKGLTSLNVERSPNKIFPKREIEEFQPKDAPITIARTFQCIQKYATDNHFLVTDVGDCLFASVDLVLPQHSFIASAYFASLGFGIPGGIGAQLANKNKRVVVLVGDGGFQMTATELSTAVRYHLDPIIILLNNHGYGTERPLLEGVYNDLQEWNYTKLTELLNGGISKKVKTEQECDQAFNEAFSSRGNFYLIEVDLKQDDYSPALRRLGELMQQ